MTDANKFQKVRYTLSSETKEVRRNRFDYGRAMAVCKRVEGRRVRMPGAFDFLQALAGCQNGKASPYGTPPVECFKQSSYSSRTWVAESMKHTLGISRYRNRCRGMSCSTLDSQSRQAQPIWLEYDGLGRRRWNKSGFLKGC